MQGWISLHRKIKDNWVWKDPLHFKIWVDFLLRANHQNSKILFDNNLIEVEKGSFITSLRKLAKEYNCSISKIRRIIINFEKDKMLSLKTTHKATHITICNYSDYQNERHTERTLKEHSRNTERTLKETDNNDNNYNNDNNINNVVDFEKFWDAYDKKVGKKEKVKSKWDKLAKQTQTEILEYIPKYIRAQPDKRFRKNPETFLNNESWKDEIITSEKKNGLVKPKMDFSKESIRKGKYAKFYK